MSDKRARLVRPEAIAEFRQLLSSPAVRAEVVEDLRNADEEHQLEPALMRIIGDVDKTPHGPTEEADIVTVHLHLEDRPILAALVLKGKSWRSVKARDVSHQLLRAAQLPTVGLVCLAAVGDIADDTKRDLAFLADAAQTDWMLLDRGDLARLLSAYQELCPNDGTWLSGSPCSACGFGRRPRPRHVAPYRVLTLEDVSFAAAKRYSADVLVPPGLDEAELENRVRAAVRELRQERYTRNEHVEAVHGGRDADVVFLFVYEDIVDRPFANWICRALWVSPDLDARWHPSGFGDPMQDDASIRIDWNRSYELMADLLSKRQDKGAYLKALDQFMTAAAALVDRVRPILAGAELALDQEQNLASVLAAHAEMPRPDRMTAAPHELAELDNLFEGVDGDLLNLALPFGPRGAATWPTIGQRLWLARQALEMFDRDWTRLTLARNAVR